MFCHNSVLLFVLGGRENTESPCASVHVFELV